MTNQIVTVNVSQTIAPTPSGLQKTGAMISQGATATAQGAKSLITQPADLTPILRGALTLASLTQSGGVATGTLKSTTIASGTYDSTSGVATLTLTASIGAVSGSPVVIDTATGTGSFADLDGSFLALDGSTGTTLKVQLPTGLTMTITGGNVAASLALANGATFWTTVAGAAEAGYNQTVLATVATSKTFTYPVAAGTATPATGAPTATPPGVVELTQMVATFFAQGSQQAVYVLELGAGTPADGVAYLTSLIAASQQFFYSYLVPRGWDGAASFLTMLAAYESTTARTYFFVTTTVGTYGDYTALMKAALTFIEAPTKPSTEFSAAAAFWVALNYAPSSVNKVTPYAFSFLFGVTPYPTVGNAALLATLKAAGVNVVGTGAEGGISDTILLWGTTMDLRPFNYWYSVDWAQINVDLAIANAVINGSNDPINPLYYNQQGIDRLQQVAASTLNNGVTYGLVLFSVKQTALDANAFTQQLDAEAFVGFTIVNAIPFIPYSKANPSDYKIGRYAGFSIVYTPLRGFDSIVFNVNVTDFVAQ